MTYFNPKIYNTKNLKPSDADVVRCSDLLMKQTLNSVATNYEVCAEDTMLDKIKAEIALEVLAEVADAYNSERTMFMVSAIDNYEEDYEAIPKEESPFLWPEE